VLTPAPNYPVELMLIVSQRTMLLGVVALLVSRKVLMESVYLVRRYIMLVEWLNNF
jgi:hypothetical protein